MLDSLLNPLLTVDFLIRWLGASDNDGQWELRLVNPDWLQLSELLRLLI